MKVRCLDCQKWIKQRDGGRGGQRKRCVPCQKERMRLYGIEYKRTLYRGRKKKKLCCRCGAARSPHSEWYCQPCADKHAEYQVEGMRTKRAANPAYREDERNKVRERMRIRRAALHTLGLNNNGMPYSSSSKAKEARTKSARLLQPVAP